MSRPESPLGAPLLHESGLLHATGEARYVDDLPAPPGMLHAFVVASPHAHARLRAVDVQEARAAAGVHAVLLAGDIPGENQVGPVVHDEPLLAEGLVHAVGQSVALVVAETLAQARRAAALVRVDYEPLPALLDVRSAIAAGAFLSEPHVIARGEVEAELARAPLLLEGELESGSAEHFYLETQVALALPGEPGTYSVYSSTQHPSEVQALVAHVLGLSASAVVVTVPRIGGGFGGKETQAAFVAVLAALGAARTGRPVKLWLDRDQDMAQTGKRHPFFTRYRAGFDEAGRILALAAELYADGGWSNDLSRAICDRAVFHVDNAYFLPAVRVMGRVVRTNLPSNTAFRGFGGPQGMLVIERIMERAARRLGIDGAELRARNYYGDSPRNHTHYEQEVSGNRLARLHRELLESSEHALRRRAVDEHNRAHAYEKRGLALMAVKFGISFTASHLNQAGALIHVYADGSVQLNHGGTEMGQGLHTKMLAVLAHALGVERAAIRVMPTATDKVPNTSATAASSGSDLNGQAVWLAAEELKRRLTPLARRMLGLPADSGELCFARGEVYLADAPARRLRFADLTRAAHLERISLSATGYYRTPGIAYDRGAGRGRPFHYFAYGAALSEVEVSGLTGEHRVRRVDIVHDVGDSLVPTIDRGQIEGGFVQGLGWLTMEEVLHDRQGRLVTHSPDTYKIPAIGDAPTDFRVRLLGDASQPGVIYGSKAVGEPPLMLAISGWLAIYDAVAAFGTGRVEPALALPATPEAILRAIAPLRVRP